MDSSFSKNLDQSKPIPAALQNYNLFIEKTVRGERTVYLLNLGYFDTREGAERARRLLTASFPKAVVSEVVKQPVAAAPAEKAPPAKVAAPRAPAGAANAMPVLLDAVVAQQDASAGAANGEQAPKFSLTEINRQAAVLMNKGREGLKALDYAAAIDAFNKLLLLPPNKYSQDAQEWVGVARERAGETAKARAEYELYLKLYTKGDGVARVKRRLAMLPVTGAPGLAEETAEKKEYEITRYGSVSMYYYHGASHVETTATVGNVLSQETLTTTDQSSLVGTLDFTERFRSEEYDNRLVLRDTYTKSFLSDQPSKNKATAAYVELKNRIGDYSGRFGRQSATGGGVLSRFDGALLGYGFMPKFRANLVAGRPADSALSAKQTFYGVSVDLGTFNESWGGSLYAITQQVDSIVDRRAVGGEVRYFDPIRTAYTLVDYDTSYSTLNTFLFQGTVNGAEGVTYNFLLDHRKTPSLQTTNSLLGATTTSIDALLQIMPEADVRALAEARTATSNEIHVGASYPFREKWQLGGDVKLSNVSGTPASGTTTLEGVMPGTAGTGNEWTYTAQAIGSNIFSTRDVSVFSLSYIAGGIYTAQSLSASNRSVFFDKWTMDASWRLYRQNNNSGLRDVRNAPTLKLTYKAKENLSLEAEGGVEITDSSGNGQTTRTNRKFFSLGFRWDY
ncbi:MAG: tetratricopeptide repeat protein [Pseudomonadota bacterium]